MSSSAIGLVLGKVKSYAKCLPCMSGFFYFKYKGNAILFTLCKQERPANAKGMHDSVSCMKAHCEPI